MLFCFKSKSVFFNRKKHVVLNGLPFHWRIIPLRRRISALFSKGTSRRIVIGRWHDKTRGVTLQSEIRHKPSHRAFFNLFATIVCAPGKWQTAGGLGEADGGKKCSMLERKQTCRNAAERDERIEEKLRQLDYKLSGDIWGRMMLHILSHSVIHMYKSFAMGYITHFILGTTEYLFIFFKLPLPCICSLCCSRCKVINYAYYFSASSTAFGEDFPPYSC